MTFNRAQLALLAALPAHPVFQTDLTAGVVALAVRFDARDAATRRQDSDYSFPGRDNARQISMMLTAVSEKLGDLVDVSPLLAVLARCTDGPDHPVRDLHDQLETLTALANDPGHVIVPDDEHDDVAIAQFLAAAHLALFGTLPTDVGDTVIGCDRCARYQRCDGRPWTGTVIASAHTRGILSPRYRVPSQDERDARYLEDAPSVFHTLLAPRARLRLALRSVAAVRRLSPSDLDAVAKSDLALVIEARALGLVPEPEYAIAT